MFQIARQLAVGQRLQRYHFAALHHLAHIWVVFRQLLRQLGLPNQHNANQPFKAVFQFKKAFQVFQRGQRQAVRLFNNQHVLVARLGAFNQRVVDLAEPRFRTALGRRVGRYRFQHRFGDMHRFERFAFLVVILHRQYIRFNQNHRLVFAVDAVLQVFAQGGFARAAFADHRHKSALRGDLKHRLAHITGIGG